MTDREAFEVFDKYSDEPTRAKIKIMLHIIGIEKTVKAIVKVYLKDGKTPPDEFINVMRQAFTYVFKQMSEPIN